MSVIEHAPFDGMLGDLRDLDGRFYTLFYMFYDIEAEKYLVHKKTPLKKRKFVWSKTLTSYFSIYPKTLDQLVVEHFMQCGRNEVLEEHMNPNLSLALIAHEIYKAIEDRLERVLIIPLINAYRLDLSLDEELILSPHDFRIEETWQAYPEGSIRLFKKFPFYSMPAIVYGECQNDDDFKLKPTI